MNWNALFEIVEPASNSSLLRVSNAKFYSPLLRVNFGKLVWAYEIWWKLLFLIICPEVKRSWCSWKSLRARGNKLFSSSLKRQKHAWSKVKKNKFYHTLSSLSHRAVHFIHISIWNKTKAFHAWLWLLHDCASTKGSDRKVLARKFCVCSFNLVSTKDIDCVPNQKT